MAHTGPLVVPGTATRLPQLEGIRDDLPALKRAHKQRLRLGNVDPKNDPPGWKDLRPEREVPGWADLFRLPSIKGVSYSKMAAASRSIWRDDAFAMGKRIDELEGFASAGGEQAYQEQQRAAELLRPQQQRELALSAERKRARRSDDVRQVAPGPRRDTGAQRTAEGRRATRGTPQRKRGRASRLIGGLGMPSSGSQILG